MTRMELLLEVYSLEEILEESGCTELEALECLFKHGLLQLPAWLEDDYDLPAEEE